MSDPIQNNAMVSSAQAAGISAPAASASASASAVASAIQEVSTKAPKVDAAAVSESEVAQAVETLNQVLKDRDISLRFEKNETLNRFIVEVVDQNTGEKVLQVPDDEVIHAVENIDRLRGILFSKEA